MTRYVTFLRAINVGGKNLIRMEELARIFAAAGCKNVRTYIQSGNVIFDSRTANAAALTTKIERTLKKVLGYDVTVILRTLGDLEELVRRNPFKKIKTDDDAGLFVVFLADEPKSALKLPLTSKIENLEVFELKDRAACTVSRRKQNGRFGFPNAFVEKQLGVSATTRNWSTVNKIVKFTESLEAVRIERKKK